jgi:HK97 gp10 family phage protein
MPFQVKSSVTGVEEAIRALQDVDKKLRKKLLRKAVNEASKIVLRAAKGYAPVKTRLLRRSLGRKVKVYSGTGAVVAWVGPRMGFRETVGTRTRGKRKGDPVFANPVKYAHLVERGTKRSRAIPFLGPAGESTQDAARDAMRKILIEGLEKAGSS